MNSEILFYGGILGMLISSSLGILVLLLLFRKKKQRKRVMASMYGDD